MKTFIFQSLVHVDIHLYTLENIEEALCRHPELTVLLCDAFAFRFDPYRYDTGKYAQIHSKLAQLIDQLDTGHDVNDIRRKNVLHCGLDFINYTLKTNFYRDNKTGLSFRLDPAYLDHLPFNRAEKFPELPYSIFYVYGMCFFAFHIRFRELSRGGLRTIFPERLERWMVERGHVFTECYNLAYTQQKKNKDIPEGGAKGVIFLEPYSRLDFEMKILTNEARESGITEEKLKELIQNIVKEQKEEYLHQAQRSFVNTLLTLINCTPDGKLRAKHVLDYLNKPEYIYLGPDELMHNEMIEWISMHSKHYDYKPGLSFITGKSRLGINHKQYGVTSLGVNVYMHEMLKFLGIDPLKEPFTIKMTGGPDGDVAGNQILNLYRYYPGTAKLVALTDGSGTIFDKEGLHLETLSGMFKKGQAIKYYPPELLHEGGYLLIIDEKQEENLYSQKTLCWRKSGEQAVKDWLAGSEMNALYRMNVHQAAADIFIPAGGRPRTLHEGNYRDFLDERGIPTARAIVEGANLYISTWGRQKLEDAGVLIIKDSSANKCGVICSSYEVLCGLALTPEEFLREKDPLVVEIQRILHKRAYDEAVLMLQRHQATKERLTAISDEISKRINLFTDQLLEYFQNRSLPRDAKDPLIQCYLNYCPPLLKEKYLKRLLTEIPDIHIKAIISSSVASTIVYKRGLDWHPTLVDVLPLVLQDVIKAR